ncbi:hypothetical protein F975_02817 [Acinetobacter sp. ANC 3789]|uniref:hypothetical protein n=1 Tax=Acinetobacter sp. ANC 3789 TaxID=1217714 RepID=UPI0002CEB277|nr:hypothetical protein [Acinetobacter sp. ANC 3789]ENU79566.1 hypothetical protein F975_02817 [Acinetobacter sp. ANC 3789]
MPQDTQGTEALRAMVTLRQCWFDHEEVYLHQGYLHCGSAVTDLIYFTSRPIQDFMLSFIGKYNCHPANGFDFLDLNDFSGSYEHFLSVLEKQVIHYAFQQHGRRTLRFEQIDSIFERELPPACA